MESADVIRNWLVQYSGMTDKVGFTPASIHALAVILITEIGDKTFFIAAVLSMRYIHSRFYVYCGAMGALIAMHILSAVMGLALPTLIPKAYTHFAGSVLFGYFGAKLLYDAREMDNDGPSEELQEVEEELIKKKDCDNDAEDVEDVEEAQPDVRKLAMESTAAHSILKSIFTSATSEHIRIFTQALTLTFLAEWGDRSQIATIALAASKNAYGVIVGGLIGHALCTGVAVIGGRMLAAKISEKHVAIVGGVLFILFAIHGFVFGPESS